MGYSCVTRFGNTTCQISLCMSVNVWSTVYHCLLVMYPKALRACPTPCPVWISQGGHENRFSSVLVDCICQMCVSSQTYMSDVAMSPSVRFAKLLFPYHIWRPSGFPSCMPFCAFRNLPKVVHVLFYISN